MQKYIIVAISDNLAIGKDNKLLWHISEDLKYFKNKTLNSSIIMGYKTFLSLGARPLPNRRNIVISEREVKEEFQNVEVVSSLQDAYELVSNEEKCFVIGGGYTYKQAINSVDKLYITHVHTIIEDADTFFPEIDLSIWEEESRSSLFTDEKTEYTFEFVIYKRKLQS